MTLESGAVLVMSGFRRVMDGINETRRRTATDAKRNATNRNTDAARLKKGLVPLTLPLTLTPLLIPHSIAGLLNCSIAQLLAGLLARLLCLLAFSLTQTRTRTHATEMDGLFWWVFRGVQQPPQIEEGARRFGI